MHGDLAVLARDPLGVLPAADVDAERLERLLDLLAREPLLAREQLALALDERDLRAERAVGLRHLDADHAAAEDHHRLRDLLGGGGLAVGPRVVDLVEALDRRHRGQGAAGEEDRLARLELLRAAVVELDRHAPLAGDAARGRAASAIPRSSSHGSCAESSRSWMISSRRASAAATSSSPVTASAAPGIAADLRERLVRAAAAPWRACTPRTSTRRRRAGPRRSPPPARRRRACPPPPRPPARRRSPPRRKSASAVQ